MIIEVHKTELEEIIRERMATGEFEDVEDVLLQALRNSPIDQPSCSQRKPKKSLGQFLLESPLRDSGMTVERQKDYPRAVDL